jgi:hypothetical protein
VPDGDLRQPTTAGWRRHTASGVVVTAITLGLRSVVDERRAGEAVVEDVPGDAYDPLAPLELHFDERGPDETWAVARPWRLRVGP